MAGSASARGAAAAASAREAASAAASAAAASATRAAGAAAGLGRSLSFTRRRSNAGPRYTTEADAAAPPADSESSASHKHAESAASSQKRAASAAGAVRRTLSFGRRSSDVLPRNWKRLTDAEGRESFFNALTNETTLERPKPLQRHWREAVDKSTGAVYYWNVRTRAVRWERQEVASDEAADGALAKAPGRAVASSREEDEDEGEAPAPPPQQQAGGASGATGRVPQAREARRWAVGRR